MLLPKGEWMRVRLDPGPRTGYKEIMLVTEESRASLEVTITHTGKTD